MKDSKVKGMKGDTAIAIAPVYNISGKDDEKGKQLDAVPTPSVMPH